MENNSRRHTKKAHISRPRSILIDKEIRSVRDSRPISTTARTTNNERANGRTNGYSIRQSRSSRIKKCTSSSRKFVNVGRGRRSRERKRDVVIEARPVRGIGLRYFWRCRAQCSRRRDFRQRLQFYQTAVVGVSVTPRERERGGRSAAVGKRETRCTALSSDIDLSVSAFDATWKKKEVGRGLLTFVGTAPQVHADAPVTRSVRHLLFSKPFREDPFLFVNSETRSIKVARKDSFSVRHW